MSEQDLNDADVDPAFQEMSGKRVPERVDSDRLGNPSTATGGPGRSRNVG
ncbi:hypothetical protein ACVIHF_008743 [Bradyrhizobium sp. USDA 4506]